MYQIIFIFILITINLMPNTSWAQKAPTLAPWLSYFGKHSFRENWIWENETQLRFHNFSGDLQQGLLRTGIGYNLTKNNNNLLIGYGFFYSENYTKNLADKTISNESRLHQQFANTTVFSRLSIQNKSRVEERFFKESASNIRVRLRHSLKLKILLNQIVENTGAFYLFFSDELFINTQGNAFDRNRFVTGLGYSVNNYLKLELGYMLQTLVNENQNIFQFSFLNNLSLDKN